LYNSVEIDCGTSCSDTTVLAIPNGYRDIISLYFAMHTKHQIDTGVYVYPNTVILAYKSKINSCSQNS